MGRLAGKVAIVTGSTSGMGRKTSERFVEEGAKVVICGRRVALGRELEAKLGRDKCLFIEADVTKEEDVMRLIKACTSQWGRIDCLFNNAGSAIPDSGIETISIEGFDKTIASVLRSAVLGMKHAAPIMRAQSSGSIINNGSIAGHRAGYSGSFIYNAAKAAVIHLTRSAAMQLGEEGVRVNSISPGFIATGLFGKTSRNCGRQSGEYRRNREATFHQGATNPAVGHARRHRTSGCFPRLRRIRLCKWP